MAGAVKSLLSGIVNALKAFATQLTGGGGPERGSKPDYDPTQFMAFLNKAQEVEDSFSGKGYEIEKAISGLIKDSMVEFTKSAASTPPPVPVAGILEKVIEKVPELMEKRGMNDLLSDYSLKNQGILDSKVDNVVGSFNRLGNPNLSALASQVGQAMRQNLGKEIPQTPAQRSGMDLTDQIDSALDKEYGVRPTNKPSTPAPSGPAR